ncbi:MAG: hypothetical protein LRY28_01250, partial [Erysipelotrichaceae bacterium]|nr:hypothetical protein [Erysipelotrichaceae bacterium]
RAIERLQVNFNSQDETAIVELLHEEVHPLLKHLRKKYPQIAGIITLYKLPADITFYRITLKVAGKMGKLNTVDFSFDWDNRYNIWSGTIGALFLFMSYFGTDQSQVQRYLSGKSLTESRIGLLFNGIFKVPMQFLILFIGILVFIFFQFNQPPVHFNSANVAKLQGTPAETRFYDLEAQHNQIFTQKQIEIRQLITAMNSNDEAAIAAADARVEELQKQNAAVRAEDKKIDRNANPQSAERSQRPGLYFSYIRNELFTKRYCRIIISRRI